MTLEFLCSLFPKKREITLRILYSTLGYALLYTSHPFTRFHHLEHQDEEKNQSRLGIRLPLLIFIEKNVVDILCFKVP